MTINEDNICVESGNTCLNMGYVIKEASESKYYYGASNTYEILNKDNLTSAKVYDNTRDVYSMTREISLENKELENNEEMELSLLWKWVDDNNNDYKIGNYVNDNPTKDIYYITISFKFKIIDKGC